MDSEICSYSDAGLLLGLSLCLEITSVYICTQAGSSPLGWPLTAQCRRQLDNFRVKHWLLKWLNCNTKFVFKWWFISLWFWSEFNKNIMKSAAKANFQSHSLFNSGSWKWFFSFRKISVSALNSQNYTKTLPLLSHQAVSNRAGQNIQLPLLTKVKGTDDGG